MRRLLRSTAMIVSAAFAQQTTQPPAQQPTGGTVTFQSSTQLVVEMVTVKDKSGKIIEGLTAKDFTVTEDGKPQTIQFLEFQRMQDTPLPTPTAAPPAPPAPAAVASVTRNQIMP